MRRALSCRRRVPQYTARDTPNHHASKHALAPLALYRSHHFNACVFSEISVVIAYAQSQTPMHVLLCCIMMSPSQSVSARIHRHSVVHHTWM